MKILISHISEEALFALLLKDFIESTFLGQFEVSLISNSGDSVVGDKWLVELDGALTSAELLLVLCSPKSIRQPWVHFKFGCAWTKSVAITCLCHSGLNKVSLPAHLRTFETLEVDDDAFMSELFNDLAKRFDIKRLPRLSYDIMKAELRATLISIAPADKSGDATVFVGNVTDAKIGIKSASEQVQPLKQAYAEPSQSTEFEPKEVEAEAAEAEPLVNRDFTAEIEDRIDNTIRERKEPIRTKPRPRSTAAVTIKKKVKKSRKKKKPPTKPESVQKRILTLLLGAGDTGYGLDNLADVLGIIGPKLEPYLDVLKDQAYIDISVEVGRPPEYTIAAKGEQYLAESKPA